MDLVKTSKAGLLNLVQIEWTLACFKKGYDNL